MIGALIFAVVGVALVAGSALGFVYQRVRFASWTATQGVVAGHRPRRTIRNGRHRTMYHPLVRFHAGGREWLHESPLSHSSPGREEGAHVALLYDPANPESACIDELVAKHFVPMLLGAIGSIFTLVGCVLLARG